MSPVEITFYYIIAFAPFILLWISLVKVIETWKSIREKEYFLSTERVMLEIKTPKEITKTPLAMELVFSALYNVTGEGTIYDRIWKGRRRPFFSFEIVSIDGHVKFHIWTQKNLVKTIESAFYAQYPTVEIREVPDYTKYFAFDPERQSLFGVEFKLSKANPYPIKTYKQFGLDKPGLKPEEVVDPIAYMLEVLGNIGHGENMWLQIVIRGQAKDNKKKKSLIDWIKTGKRYDVSNWSSEAQEIIKELKDKTRDTEGDISFQTLTLDREKDVINSIVDNISKPSYWTGIRAVYFADKDSFDGSNISPMANIFSTLRTEDYNFLNAGGFTTSFSVPWHDLGGDRMVKIKKGVFSDYKRRKFYTDSIKIWPKKKKYNDFVLSSEELATIFHLPPSTAAAPTFERSESKKGEAPSNLPF